ncbi:MAG TPA: hypothetical protein VNA28_04775 [Solirubrobacteraceae bacterium]|nr:hypothetical protein [Solirubrobacteraceae bacterium]
MPGEERGADGVSAGMQCVGEIAKGLRRVAAAMHEEDGAAALRVKLECVRADNDAVGTDRAAGETLALEAVDV